jgi:hypothetical protein
MRMYRLISRKILCGCVVTLLAALTLSGCGGSGGSSSGTPDTPAASITSVMAVGVIAESKTADINSVSLGSGSVSPNWKRLDVPLVNQTGVTTQRIMANSINLTGKDIYAYIYLAWNAVTGANSYQVCYNGTPVWDSTDSHPNDPAVGPTQAYLDVNEELSGKISAVGSYSFQIKAFNVNGTLLAEGIVAASLGVKLGDYPKNITYVNGTHQLSWTGVSGANGYRVQLYKGADYTNCSLDSSKAASGSLIIGAGYDLSGKGLEGDYAGIVDAYATDSGGHPLEIARGIFGMTY